MKDKLNKAKKSVADHWGKGVSLAVVIAIILGISDRRVAAINTRIDDKHGEAMRIIDARYSPLAESIKRIDRRQEKMNAVILKIYSEVKK